MSNPHVASTLLSRAMPRHSFHLVSSKDVPCIDLLLDVVEATVVTVCYDGLASFLEFFEVVDNEAAEEGTAVLEGGLVDDDYCALGFDAFHDALDSTLAEVVTVAFHRQPVDTNRGNGLLLHTPHPFGELPYFRGAAIILVVFGISIIAGHLEDLVGDEVLPRPVAFDDGGHHVLWDILVVSQKLLGVLGEAVAAIAVIFEV